MSNKPIQDMVAEALAQASSRAGQAFSSPSPQDATTRAANLTRQRKYGAYVEAGDPHGHGDSNSVATIYMEQQGTADDCQVPLDYYHDGFDVSELASDLLDGYHIEFVNAAVATVYKD